MACLTSHRSEDFHKAQQNLRPNSQVDPTAILFPQCYPGQTYFHYAFNIPCDTLRPICTRRVGRRVNNGVPHIQVFTKSGHHSHACHWGHNIQGDWIDCWMKSRQDSLFNLSVIKLSILTVLSHQYYASVLKRINNRYHFTCKNILSFLHLWSFPTQPTLGCRSCCCLSYTLVMDLTIHIISYILDYL